MADPYIPVIVLGDTKGLNKTFLAQVKRAAAAAGATSIYVSSGKRSDASHPGGPTNTGVANSNHLTGQAIDGYAVINGQQVPLGTALLPFVGQYGLRSGDVDVPGGFYKGGRDPSHVDNGANVGGVKTSDKPAPFVVAPRDTGGKGPPGSGKALAALIKYAPGYQKYVGAVKNAAKLWGADPVQLLSLLAFENTSADPNITNSAGARGLAQIVDRTVGKGLNPAAYEAFASLYGTQIPDVLAHDPNYAINYAAFRLAGTIQNYGGDLNAWYRGNYNPGFTGDSRGAGPAALLKTAKVGNYQPTIPQSPSQGAAAATAAATAKAQSDAYIAATTGLSVVKATAVAQAKALQHFTDPWITVTTRNGRVTGFGAPSTGENPPANVLTVQGQPVTQSTFQTLWDASRNNLFESYTGRAATPGEIVGFVSKGLSFYQMRAQLAKTPEFMKSPVWKQEAPGVRATVKAALGTDPPAAFVARAISENWTPDTLAANIKTLPGYHQGPEYLQNFSAAKAVYGTIYGAPDHEGNAWLKTVATQGWTQQQVADALRSAPEYKHSLEYANNVGDLLDTLGMFVGRRAAFKSTKIPNPPLPTGGLGSTVKVLTPGPSPTVGLQPTFGKA